MGNDEKVGHQKVRQMTKFVLGKIDLYTLLKGENSVYRHLLLFPQCFPNPSLEHRSKSGLCSSANFVALR